MKLTIGETILTATLADNSSVKALEEKLQDGPITIRMEDYARMEKVGNLPFRLPTNDQSITTQAGDLILYLGNSFVIYYAPNSWRFTRLGHIEGVTAQELKKVLGRGDVTVTLSIYFCVQLPERTNHRSFSANGRSGHSENVDKVSIRYGVSVQFSEKRVRQWTRLALWPLFSPTLGHSQILCKVQCVQE